MHSHNGFKHLLGCMWSLNCAYIWTHILAIRGSFLAKSHLTSQESTSKEKILDFKLILFIFLFQLPTRRCIRSTCIPRTAVEERDLSRTKWWRFSKSGKTKEAVHSALLANGALHEGAYGTLGICLTTGSVEYFRKLSKANKDEIPEPSIPLSLHPPGSPLDNSLYHSLFIHIISFCFRTH